MAYKEQAPGVEVPSTLLEIAPILCVSNEIESENPRVAYLCRFYAFEKAHKLDPATRAERLNKANETTSGGRRYCDAHEMQEFYRHYYGTYIQGLQNVERKACQIAAILFEVLKAVSLDQSVEVADEILKANAHVAEKGEMHTYNVLPLASESSDQRTLRQPTIKQSNPSRIPLQAIRNCTQDFHERNFIGTGGYGRVYKGILSWGDHVNQLVAVKRLNVNGFQGNKEFLNEVTMLSRYHHKNIITLIGFCRDDKEMILVYDYASRGSLDAYLRDTAKSGGPSWPQLLKICIGVASALDYLHNHVAETHRIIHRDIKSANVLLDENWNAKLSDFGLARIGLANTQNTFVITNLAGTHGYCDPQYETTGLLTKESDVYSFGVVLFEVLCGRLGCVSSYNDERRFLHHLARTCYKNAELDKIIDQRIQKDIKPRTLLKFSAIAYQCLQTTRETRPKIGEVVFQLNMAMKIQLEDEIQEDKITPQDGDTRTCSHRQLEDKYQRELLPPTCYRVAVQEALKPHVIVPGDKKEVLSAGDVVGSFVDWPKRLITFHNPEEEPSKKRKTRNNSGSLETMKKNTLMNNKRITAPPS